MPDRVKTTVKNKEFDLFVFCEKLIHEWKTLFIFIAAGFCLGGLVLIQPQRSFKAVSIVHCGTVFYSNADSKYFMDHVRDVIVPDVFLRLGKGGKPLTLEREDIYLSGFRNGMALYIKVSYGDPLVAKNICDLLSSEIVAYGNGLFDIKYQRIAGRMALLYGRLAYLKDHIKDLHAKIPVLSRRDLEDSSLFDVLEPIESLIQSYEKEHSRLTDKLNTLKNLVALSVRFSVTKTADLNETMQEYRNVQRSKFMGCVFLGLTCGIMAVFFKNIKNN